MLFRSTAALEDEGHRDLVMVCFVPVDDRAARAEVVALVFPSKRVCFRLGLACSLHAGAGFELDGASRPRSSHE